MLKCNRWEKRLCSRGILFAMLAALVATAVVTLAQVSIAAGRPPGGRILIVWKGASPANVEDAIVHELETALAGRRGVATVTSISAQGQAEVFVAGEWDATPAELSATLLAALVAAREKWPFGAHLQRLEVETEFSGVPKVKIEQRPQLEINLDREELARHGIDVTALTEQLEKKKVLLNTDATEKGIQELEATTIETPQGKSIPLRRVARIVAKMHPSHRIRGWPPEVSVDQPTAESRPQN